MTDLVLSLFPKTIFISKLNNSKKEINEILKTLENIKTYKSYQNTVNSYGNVTHASYQKMYWNFYLN
jgi:Ran GTPase-activating protein (RanGAP) involved in mRNA processing and transport